MKLYKPEAEIFVPDGTNVNEAIARTTHMVIAAHQDDIEIMAYHGIVECFGKPDKWMFGVVVTDGAGSPRNGLYAHYTDEEMKKVRKLEQKKAAFIGEYGAQALLSYTSAEVKDAGNRMVVEELKNLIAQAKPEVIYTHNPADKHDTHVAVALRVISAIRELPERERPEKVYGCEGWRGLDWMNDEDKIKFDVGAYPNLAMALVGVFDSQISGGKRYDQAMMGRRQANATFSESHATDSSTALIYGMDLTPLIRDVGMDVRAFVQQYIDRFSNDVKARLERLG